MIKLFLTFLTLFITAFASIVTAQTDITFPIPELGNCNNVSTCKVYCDQSENHQSCIDFAKSKGFYKEKVDKKHIDAAALAKTELGCSSFEECKKFCEQKANREKCSTFGQKHGLVEDELLNKAREHLGCDSFESCRALCDQKGNYTKCAALLQDQVTTEDQAMFEKYKPQITEFLGCDSMVTCMAFCMNPLNMPKCTELGSKIGGSEQIPNQESPQVWCPKVSSECRWDGTNCVCSGPQTCAQSNDIPGCTWNGTQCNCPGIEGSPEEWCPKAGPGCAWDGKQCTCPGSDSTSGSVPPTPEPGEVWCPRTPGCAWTGEVCQCTPVQAPQTEPTPTPTVQGVTSKQGLLQQIIEFVLSQL